MINRMHIMGGKFLIMTAQHLAGINLPCIITSPFPTSANLQVLNNIYVADTLWKAIQLELHTSVMIGWDPRGPFPRQCTGFHAPNAKSFLPPETMIFAETILPWIKCDMAQKNVNSGWPQIRISTFEWENICHQRSSSCLWHSLFFHLYPGSTRGAAKISPWAIPLKSHQGRGKLTGTVLIDSVTWGTLDFYRLQSATTGAWNRGKAYK